MHTSNRAEQFKLLFAKFDILCRSKQTSQHNRQCNQEEVTVGELIIIAIPMSLVLSCK